MSRVGLKPIEIPSGVKVGVNEGVVTVEGPKGKMVQPYNTMISINIDGDKITLSRANEEKQTKAFHGLYRSLINNMITGVSKGFSKALIVNGVGYRCEVSGSDLILNLGYSSQIWYSIPKGVTISCDGPTKVIVSGIDKQIVGQVAAEIRALRGPEPYKGKGIRYEDETIRRKVGKSGVK